MKVFFLILLFIGIAAIQIVQLFKKRLLKESVVSIVLLSIGFTLSLLLVLKVRVPNPNDIVGNFIKFMTKQK